MIKLDYRTIKLSFEKSKLYARLLKLDSYFLKLYERLLKLDYENLESSFYCLNKRFQFRKSNLRN